MRSRTSTWFETRVRYDKTMEDGQNKKVIEQYVVDAFSFSEAEEFITEEMSHYVSGEFDVKAISPAPFGEIFFSDIDTDDKVQVDINGDERLPVASLTKLMTCRKALEIMNGK